MRCLCEEDGCRRKGKNRKNEKRRRGGEWTNSGRVAGGGGGGCPGVHTGRWIGRRKGRLLEKIFPGKGGGGSAMKGQPGKLPAAWM